MDVVSVCAFRVAPLYWQPRPGVHAMTVVCRATYDLVPGQARLASVQDYPNEEDNHWNDDPARSLYGASDLVPFKPRCDVTLVGDAFAPHGQPVRSLVARLTVGEIDKSIEVVGDRAWNQEGELVEGERFARMALRWERAAGGPDTNNPVGVDTGAEPDRYGRVALPNLQPVGFHVSDRSEPIPAVCFAPLASDWPVRRILLGRHAASWPSTSWSEHPLPPDIDGAYFNSAPSDQRAAELRADQRIVLENLHPSEPRLVCNLPGAQPRAFVERSGVVRDIALAADTLWIDTVRAICTVTWRGRLDIASPSEPGRVYVALEEPGTKLAWADVARVAGEARARSAEVPVPASPPSASLPSSAQAILAARAGIEPGEATMVGVLKPGNQPLPFAKTEEGRSPMTDAPLAAVKGRSGAKTLNVPVMSPEDRSPAWLSRSVRLEPDQAAAAGFSAPAVPSPQESARVGMAGPPPPPPRVPTQVRQAAALSVPAASPNAPEPSVASPWAATTPGAPPAPQAPAAAPAVPPVVVPPPVASSPGFMGPNPIAAYAPSSAAGAAAEPASVEGAESRAAAARAPGASEIVELLWFEPGVLAKLRTTEPWSSVLQEMEGGKRGDDVDFDEEPEPEEPPEKQDRRDIIAVMTHAHCSPAAELPRIMLDSVDESGCFEPPVALVTGRLHFPFDELEELKATVTLVTPLSSGNKKLTDLCDMVKELMQTPWLQSSGEMAEGLTQKIREEFKQANRMVSPDYLDDHAQRMLLEQRHYQKRMVFGEEWIRAQMNVPPGRETIPAYLPAALSKELPMFQSFPARLLAEVHLQQDQYESHDLALKVLGLGRVVTFGRFGSH